MTLSGAGTSLISNGAVTEAALFNAENGGGSGQYHLVIGYVDQKKHIAPLCAPQVIRRI